MKEIVSQQFSLNWRDFLKGALLAVLTPVVTVIYSTVQNGSLTFDWQAIGVTGLSAFLAYMIKNFLEPTKVINLKPSEAKVEQVKNAA